MLLLTAPNTHDFRPLPFYLAMEQWAAKFLPDQEVFFTWAVNPTVIIGRHQQLDTEVDVDFCRDNGIDIVRRRSGGGCVYADPDNLMISHVCPTSRPVSDVFADFVRLPAGILRKFGLDATVSGRNDILIGDRKVSGCAYYHTGTHAIVHSTLLFGADPARMMRAITPERSKLATKGVQSVASRITTIAEHRPDITIDRFRAECKAFIDVELTLSAEQEEQVRAIESTYRTPGWLEGRRRRGNVSKKARIDGVGLVQVSLTLSNGRITESCITGDFLIGTVPITEIGQKLTGQQPDRLSLDGIDVGKAIIGLSNQQLINILK